MKLFDRSVNLAQFESGSSLYPVCRAWMANDPNGAAPNPTTPRYVYVRRMELAPSRLMMQCGRRVREGSVCILRWLVFSEIVRDNSGKKTLGHYFLLCSKDHLFCDSPLYT